MPDDKPAALLRGLLVGVAVLTALGKLGDAAGPALVATRPLLLLALNANDLHCALTAALGPAQAPSREAWWLVALARRLVEDPLFFALGWAYQDHPHLAWARALAPGVFPLAPASGASGATSARAGGQTAWARGASRLAVVLEPGAVVCAVAGAAQMPPAEFAALNVCGTFARLACLRGLGAAFPGPLTLALALVQRHQTPLLAVALFGAGLGTAALLRRLYSTRSRELKVE
jgi:hypothetical protein